MMSTEFLIGFGVTAVTVIGHIFVANDRIKQNEKSLKDIWRWKDSHVKEAVELRERFQNQLSELKGKQSVTDEKFTQILSRLAEILARLTTLENKNSRN